MPQPKKAVYVRLEADVLDWLKSKGKGYQTRMNAMLRALMEIDRHPHWGVIRHSGGLWLYTGRLGWI